MKKHRFHATLIRYRMKDYYLYIILWVGGCFIAALITVLWKDKDKQSDTFLFGEKTISLNTSGTASSNIVNELLLSAKDLDISGSTLVSPGYKREAEKIEKYNMQQVYDNILKNKLDNVSKKKTTSEFTIKPLPLQNQTE